MSGTKTAVRLNQVQTMQLGQLLGAWKEQCNANKWTLSYVHEETQKKLGFTISKATVGSFGKELGLEFFNAAASSLARADAVNPFKAGLRKALDDALARILVLESAPGSLSKVAALEVKVESLEAQLLHALGKMNRLETDYNKLLTDLGVSRLDKAIEKTVATLKK